jgi:hypothetical protein
MVFCKRARGILLGTASLAVLLAHGTARAQTGDETASSTPPGGQTSEPTEETPLKGEEPDQHGYGVLGPVRVGVLIGILALPRPIQAEIGATYRGNFGIGFQFSMLPGFTIQGASYTWWSVLGLARWFPFRGAFHLGLGIGYQKLALNATVDPVSGSLDLSTAVLSPQIGWLWGKDGVFTIGLGLGVQIPLSSGGSTQISSSLPPEVMATATDQINQVKKIIDTDAKPIFQAMRVPVIDLLKIGVFF